MKYLLILIVSVFGPDWASSQHMTLKLIKTCTSDAVIKDTLLSMAKGNTTSSLGKEIIDDFIAQSRLEASIDSISFDSLSQTYLAYLHIGPRYRFDKIRLDSTSNALLERLEIASPTTGDEYVFTREALNNFLGDNGYPFADISLNSLKMLDGVVHGSLRIKKNNLVIMDSLVIHGKAKIRQGYLRNYLDIRKGEPYDHSKIIGAREKLDKLSFLKLEADPELSFIYDYASLNLYLEPKNTSRFDLIFGIIPQSATESRSLSLSLDFTAELLNKLGYGEYIYLDFERLRPEQQKLSIKFNYPYLFDTPFSIDAEFSLQRNATSFQTSKSNLGVRYLINNTDYIKVGWNFEGSRIVDVDTTAILSSQTLPDELSVTQSGLSLGFLLSRLDYRINPRKGYALQLGFTAGLRKILLDQNILSLVNGSFDPQGLYNELNLRSSRYEVTSELSYFLPVARRAAIAAIFRGGLRYSPEPLLTNEKFQIGGNNLLRGFDEASIFTEIYAVQSLEYRLLLSQNSFLSAPFVDIGYINNDENYSLAIGIGAGLSIETKVGLFNFAVASGRRGDIPFEFNRPKVHFGYLSLF